MGEILSSSAFGFQPQHLGAAFADQVFLAVDPCFVDLADQTVILCKVPNASMGIKMFRTALPVVFCLIATPGLSDNMAIPVFRDDSFLRVPIFAQIVVSPVPDGFLPIFENADDGFYISEVVPKGETVDEWSQMITVTALKDAVRTDQTLGLPAYAEILAKGYQQACPQSFNTHQYILGESNVKGAKGTIAVLMSCGKIEVARGPAKEGGEAVLIVFFAGEKDIYTVQWSLHYPDEDESQQPFPDEKWLQRLNLLLGSTRICDRLVPKGPPYPLCPE